MCYLTGLKNKMDNTTKVDFNNFQHAHAQTRTDFSLLMGKKVEWDQC